MICRRAFFVVLLSILLSSCASTSGNLPSNFPTYDPFVHIQGTASTIDANSTGSPAPTRTAGPTPTRAPLSVTVPTHNSDAPLASPTPNLPRTLPTPRQDSNQYVVKQGDTLGSIAQSFGVSVETLQQANNLTDQNVLSIGEALNVPAPVPGKAGSAFKIIPDSELVYGPASAQFDISAFAENRGGYLATYSQDMNGESLTGAQVVERVAQEYSVNPRLLLALLEYRSKWVTSTDPPQGSLDYPLGFIEPNHVGLYHQLAWAANELNRGFYLWQANAIGTWVLGDGSIVPIDPTINAGTAGVQHFFSILDDRQTWDTDVNIENGFFQTYFFRFGNPFDLAIEPLLPLNLVQPRLDLPFEPGALWAFTGGPHAGWDSGSAWAALDFAPADIQGCAVSSQWVTAAANGIIVRAKDGQVMEDLDGDGYEQTGWDILYMHVAAQDRVEAGMYVFDGDRIGHPSCEGGIANAAHLHLVRKYNGEWIAADGSMPFILGGWTSSGNGIEYDGYLKRGSSKLEAAEGISDLNQITR
jgi:LasA protease